jgi:hypothetical protein
MALDRSTTNISLATSLVILLSALACTPTPTNEANPGAGQAPDAGVVCQHVRTLAAKDNGDEQVLDQVQRQCVQALGGLESRYATFVTCVESATTSTAVVECEKALAKPPSLLAAASPTAQLEELCGHVIALLGAELPKMGQSIKPDELVKLQERCINDAGAKLLSAGAEAFAQQSACILASTDLQTLQGCGSF